MTAIAIHSHAVPSLDGTARARSARRRSHIAMAGILMAVSSTISSSLLYTASADREVNSQYTASLSAYTAAAHRVQKAAQLQARQQQTAMEIAAAAALPQQTLRSVALANIARALPPGMSLTSMSMEPGPDDERITVAGKVTNNWCEASFIHRLSQSGTFKRITAVNPNPPGPFEALAVFSGNDMGRSVAAAALQGESGSN